MAGTWNLSGPMRPFSGVNFYTEDHDSQRKRIIKEAKQWAEDKEGDERRKTGEGLTEYRVFLHDSNDWMVLTEKEAAKLFREMDEEGNVRGLNDGKSYILHRISPTEWTTEDVPWWKERSDLSE